MNLLRKLFGLCQHQWELHAQFEKVRNSDNSKVGQIYLLKCSKCGDMKRSGYEIPPAFTAVWV
jgi:hypothetical protein